MTDQTGIGKARDYFPRGLRQPEFGYRFSMDSLLLASFAAQSPKTAQARGLDLGAGCGVVSLALLLGWIERGGHLGPADESGVEAGPVMTGLEVNAEQVDNARKNGMLLGLDAIFHVQRGDVRNVRAFLEPESFDFAVFNPPFRERGRGRGCQDESRDAARFEGEGGLDDFLGAAAFALKNKGRCFLVLPAERLADLHTGLRRARLEPKRLRLVHSRPDGPGKLVLVEGLKNGAPGLAVEPTLILYSGRRLTAQALAFCRYLECNPSSC